MRPEDRDLAYLWDMHETVREVADMLGSMSEEEYLANRVVQRAVASDRGVV